MATVVVDVRGVKQTLKTLRQIDPELRKEFNRNARTIVKPITDDAKRRINRLPLSGLRRAWTPRGRAKPITPVTAGRIRSGVTFKVDTRKKAVSVFTVRMVNAAGSVIDMAGRRNPGNQLARSLQTAGFGTASRFMWPAAEAHISDVQDELVGLITDASETINRQLERS